MSLKLIDVEKIEKWMVDIEKYDYNKLPKDKREKMGVILTARYEAYQNVLRIAK